MEEFVGVVDHFLLTDGERLSVSPLKQQALVFNRLAVPQLRMVFLRKKRTGTKNAEALAEMQWLYENGIILDQQINPYVLPASREHEKEMEATLQHTFGMLSVLFGDNLSESSETKNNEVSTLNEDEIEKIFEKIMNLPEFRKVKDSGVFKSPEFLNEARSMTMHQARMLSIELREVHGLDAHPVLSTTIPKASQSVALKSDIIRITLNSLPIPDDSTSWEQIIEYRNDPDSQSKFLALRNWMSEVARAKLTPAEVEEKLEYLLDQYQLHLKLHRMKTNTGTMETIITTGAEVLGDLLSFKWGKATEVLFSLRKRQVALLEGELTSPGNEVAYIIKARETF
jgi:hypothetical protein